MWILTEEGVGDFLITSVTWCTCEPCETKTKETLAEETPETGEAKNKITKMEETPKLWNTLGIEEAREPAAAIRKETKRRMETGPGAARKTMGSVDTKTRNDENTEDAVRP